MPTFIEMSLFNYNYEKNEVEEYKKKIVVLLNSRRVIFGQLEYILTNTNINFGYPFQLKTNEKIYYSDITVLETNLGKTIF